MEILSSPITSPPTPLLSASNSAFFRTDSAFPVCIPSRRGGGLKSRPLVVCVPGRTTQRAKRGMSCTALFGLGVPELAVIAGVAVLLFGPKKLPEFGKSLGKTVKSFQQAAKEFESEIKKEPGAETELPAETPVAMTQEENQDIKASSSSSKESV